MPGASATVEREPVVIAEVLGPSGTPVRLPLAGPSAVLGRAAGCGVRLDHGMVSRQHARLDLLPEGRWQVADLQSHDGTNVNGAAVTSAVLADGRGRVAVSRSRGDAGASNNGGPHADLGPPVRIPGRG